MNMILAPLPTTVNIVGKRYKINSNFRTSIKFELLMQDENLDKKEKLIRALKLYYPIIPNNINIAIEKIIWFYKAGKEDKEIKSIGNKVNNIIYSFEYDDDYIYSAFLSQYNIDLNSIEYLHWWKFKALFKSLNSSNEIVKVMEYRAIDLNKIKDKEQKEFYRKMKKIYEIPLPKNEQEKLNAIEEVLMNGGDLSKIL